LNPELGKERSVFDTAKSPASNSTHRNRSGFYGIFDPQFFEEFHFSASAKRFTWQRLLSSPLITYPGQNDFGRLARLLCLHDFDRPKYFV
jgi:hypothetical protein